MSEAIAAGATPSSPTTATRMRSSRPLRAEPWRRRVRGAVADAAEIVFVSLPTPDVVLEVACGEDGLVAGSAVQVLCRPLDDGLGRCAPGRHDAAGERAESTRSMHR